MKKDIVIPLKVQSMYYEMCMEVIPDGGWVDPDAQSFGDQVSEVWQSEPLDEQGVPTRNRDRDFFVYVTPAFIIYLYDRLAYEAECHTNWVNKNLREVLNNQLRDVEEIVPKLMEYNEATEEESVMILQDLGAKIGALEAKFKAEQDEKCKSGYEKGMRRIRKNPSWPIE